MNLETCDGKHESSKTEINAQTDILQYLELRAASLNCVSNLELASKLLAAGCAGDCLWRRRFAL